MAELPFPAAFVPDPGALPERALAPRVTARMAWGERVMLSRVTIEPGGVVPAHRHPHEQAGVCLSGRFELTVGSETRVVGPGEMYFILGGVVHSARGLDQTAVTLDIFSPVRDEYKP
jgi:quercetin dioxygenase-like cupin family protein